LIDGFIGLILGLNKSNCNIFPKPPYWFLENLLLKHTMFLLQPFIQFCKIFPYINFYLLFDDGNEKLTILMLLFCMHYTFFTYAILKRISKMQNTQGNKKSCPFPPLPHAINVWFYYNLINLKCLEASSKTLHYLLKMN
jgi:hypothetical protein